jgi:hypothetical protein
MNCVHDAVKTSSEYCFDDVDEELVQLGIQVAKKTLDIPLLSGTEAVRGVFYSIFM